jgi:hypothetical protein
MPLFTTPPVIQATPIVAGTSANTVVKASPGKFYGMIASSLGAGIPIAYDNATTNSGTPLGVLPASLISAPFAPSNAIPAQNGITISGGVTNPAITVFWSN